MEPEIPRSLTRLYMKVKTGRLDSTRFSVTKQDTIREIAIELEKIKYNCTIVKEILKTNEFDLTGMIRSLSDITLALADIRNIFLEYSPERYITEWLERPIDALIKICKDTHELCQIIELLQTCELSLVLDPQVLYSQIVLKLKEVLLKQEDMESLVNSLYKIIIKKQELFLGMYFDVYFELVLGTHSQRNAMLREPSFKCLSEILRYIRSEETKVSIMTFMNVRPNKLREYEEKQGPALSRADKISSANLMSKEFELAQREIVFYINKSVNFSLNQVRSIAIRRILHEYMSKEKIVINSSILLGTMFFKGKQLEIVIKRYSSSSSKIFELKSITQEIEIYKLLQDLPYIAKFYGEFSYSYFINLKKIYEINIVLKYYLNTLDKHINHNLYNPISINDGETQALIRQLLENYYFLEEVNCVIHRDIKPENIFLSKHKIIKIADFNISTVMQEGHRKIVTHAQGTPGYMAPEICNQYMKSTKRDEQFYYDPIKADVFSLGLTILNLVTLKNVDSLNNNEALLNQVIDTVNDASIQALLRSMLAFNPDERSSFSELKNSLIASPTSSLFKFTTETK